jgi:ribosomal protein S10
VLLIYSLKIKSIHLKYLLLGVLTLLDLLKKKEQVVIKGIQTKKKKKKIRKYTVLKSPFINKKSREQFKLQFHTIIITFSVKAEESFYSLETFTELVFLRYLKSQYLEVTLLKKYKAFALYN